MQVSKCMTRNVRIADPDETIQTAAKKADLDTGALTGARRL